MNKIIYLNLNEVALFGWEVKKSDKVIDHLVRAIEAGADFPPVPVQKLGEAFFLYTESQTVMNVCDGGHCRAAAHYIANAPLKCALVPKEPALYGSWVHIKNMKLIDDFGDYELRKKRFKGYRISIDKSNHL